MWLLIRTLSDRTKCSVYLVEFDCYYLVAIQFTIVRSTLIIYYSRQNIFTSVFLEHCSIRTTFLKLTCRHINRRHICFNIKSILASSATVDQVSRAHGLILGSGKPGLNQVWAVLNWEGVRFQVPGSAPAFVSLAQTSIWVNTFEKNIAKTDHRCPIFRTVCIILTLTCYLTGMGGVVVNVYFIINQKLNYSFMRCQSRSRTLSKRNLRKTRVSI